ncbi:MAG: serine/threonine-protein kinase [Acidobacteria bacterium]|nr:serine/threonine-protein kinase [Acidobacteriota bacterium]
MSMIGKSLAHYSVTVQIGKGGMGEVYQATDKKLGRDVAIKVLPEEFAKDADRIARFQREAKLLASLNHPNIAAIYGLEEVDGTHFLVMELIEGDTLADRIKTGTIPVSETLKLALQIAEALEAAHEKGVIHRDLKPANIKVTPDGKVKVLDFGLAKAFAGEQSDLNLSNSPTLSDMATQQGLILGTAAYMSPEQTRGKPVDKRTDIWAFGCVLYEMLTGQAAFQGEDVTEILAAVVKSGVNLDLLPANIHFRVREVITRCLQKEQKKRYGGVGEAQYEIEQVLADPAGVLAQPGTAGEPRNKLRTILPWVAAAIIIAGVSGWLLKPSPPPEPKPVTRFIHELSEGRQFSRVIAANRVVSEIAVSPDGRQFAYNTTGGMYLRTLDELNARFIPGSDANSFPYSFSPDGQWIAFWSQQEMKLKKVAVSGGAPLTICDTSPLVMSASWDLEDTIVYSDLMSGIMQINANGGTPEILIKGSLGGLAAGDGVAIFPQMLPDGKNLLFTSASVLDISIKGQIEILSLESMKRKVLIEGGMLARFLPSGHIVYRVGDDVANIFAVPFDLDTLEKTGGSVSVLEGVTGFSVSNSGTMVYTPQPETKAGVGSGTEEQNKLVWVDRKGKEESAGADPGDYRDLKISPDGTRAALTVNKDGNVDIRVFDFARKNMTRLTFHEMPDNNPLWTPDSQKILFQSNREGISVIYDKSANGTGGIEKLGSASDRMLIPWSWSGDGDTLVLWELSLASLSQDIGIMSMQGDHEQKPLLNQRYNEGDPQISPKGRWLAYQSDESGEYQIYVVSFPDIDEGKWQVSTDGGISPRWSPDGRELFYIKDNSVMVAAVETEPVFKPGNQKVLFEGDYLTLGAGTPIVRTPWDIHPDGKRFLMIKTPASTPAESTTGKESGAVSQPKMIVVLNWLEELKEKVPVK